MTPAPEDIIVQGKRGLCGFASTNLDFVLRQNGITNIALGGFLTNCCVESTMRTGYENGYKVVTLTDCTAATSEEGQKAERIAATLANQLLPGPRRDRGVEEQERLLGEERER